MPTPEMPTTTTAAPITCEYVVESVNNEAKSASVRFINPYYSGNFIVDEETPDPVVEGQPQTYTKKKVDKDPNPHMTKIVNIPFNASGVDMAAFTEILKGQAQGVRNRMDSLKASQSALTTFDHLVGMSSTPTAA